MSKNKENRTYLLTKEIIAAIEKAANDNKIGDSKNTIVKKYTIFKYKKKG